MMARRHADHGCGLGDAELATQLATCLLVGTQFVRVEPIGNVFPALWTIAQPLLVKLLPGEGIDDHAGGQRRAAAQDAAGPRRTNRFGTADIPQQVRCMAEETRAEA